MFYYIHVHLYIANINMTCAHHVCDNSMRNPKSTRWPYLVCHFYYP